MCNPSTVFPVGVSVFPNPQQWGTAGKCSPQVARSGALQLQVHKLPKHTRTVRQSWAAGLFCA